MPASALQALHSPPFSRDVRGHRDQGKVIWLIPLFQKGYVNSAVVGSGTMKEAYKQDQNDMQFLLPFML